MKLSTIAKSASVLLLVGGLALNTACGTLLEIQEECVMGAIEARGPADRPHYAYTLNCGVLEGKVEAVYDTTTGKAQEQVKGPRGKGQAVWTCPDDPWSSEKGGTQTCVRLQAEASGDGNVIPLSYVPSLPYTAEILTDQQHHTLHAQLQNALRPAPTPPPTPTPISIDPALAEHLDSATFPRISRTGTPAGGAVASAPDLVAVRVSGESALTKGTSVVYEAVLRNDGGPAKGTATMTISFSGGLTGEGVVETPAGFSCSGTTSISCSGSLGGTADAVQSRVVTVRVRARVTASGTGRVSLQADPAGTLAEPNEGNNYATLAVTIK